MRYLPKKSALPLCFIYLFFEKHARNNRDEPPLSITLKLFSRLLFSISSSYMKIAILEICASTHYTLTNALIKTYSTDPNNQIVVYTSAFIAKVIEDGGISPQTHLVIFDPQTSDAEDFLNALADTPFDRLHICTIADKFKAFIQFKPHVGTIFFHIHDVDVWFQSSFSNSFKNTVFNILHYPDKAREVARFGREVWVRNPARTVILNNLLRENLYFVVLSHHQKEYLSRFVAVNKIITFPTLINENIASQNDQATGKIRICIPGMVTDTRRDYTGLFKILEKILPKIKDKLVFDFLGFVEKRELKLLQKLQNLERMGLDVLYSADFVDAVTFDASLKTSPAE